MIISRVELHRVELPLKHRFETSSHSKRIIDHILVRLVDEDGAEGWGEIASGSDPYFSSESTDTAWLVSVKYLIPAILGRRFETPADLEGAWRKVRGHRFAKAGFSIAAWVLEARRQGRSLARLVGGTREGVVAGVSLGIEPTIDGLLGEVAKHVDAGYPRVKLKIAPGWDVGPVGAVRDAFPGLDLHVDANGGYPATDDAVAALVRLDAFDLTMIEQPHGPRDFLAHARLQSRVATPICLDESVEDVEDLETMLALDAGRVLNIKLSRVGGIGSARRLHDVSVAHGMPVWCGGMHEFGIGRLANIAISSLPGFTLPSDVSSSDKYYDNDIVDPPVIADRGTVHVPTDTGLGHAIDTERIAQRAVAHYAADAPGTSRDHRTTPLLPPERTPHA